MLYPFIIKHARRVFPSDDSAAVFVAKLFAVWLVALFPFAVVVVLSPSTPVADSSFMQELSNQSGVRLRSASPHLWGTAATLRMPWVVAV